MTEDQNINGKVIVTYGRSIIALMIAQSLGRRGAEIIGCDSVDMTVLSFSRFVSKNEIYTSPDDDEDAFIGDMVTMAEKHKPEGDRPYLLIPAFNEGRLLAKHRDRFKGLITIAYPSAEAVAKVNPKDNFARTLETLDISAPQTWLPENADDLKSMTDEMDFPVFIKPADDVGGRGISKIKNAADLLNEYAALKKRYESQQILIQETCEGEDYCYCGLFDHGRRVTGMVYHNISKFPHESGAGVVRETVDASAFHDIVESLMKPVKWHGVAEIDFMWNGNNATKPKIIEVNARFWAGLDHSVKSDMDFPYMIYKLFADGHVTSDEGAGREADIGKVTKLPGLATMSSIESLFSEAIHFEDLEEHWPEIKNSLKQHHYKKAMDLFGEGLRESFTLHEAVAFFKELREDVKDAERISYAKDDPYIGLGVLFVFASLLRHGKLPPEVKF